MKQINVMQSLAEYVMRGRKQAIGMTLLFNLIPFLGWISDVIMALVTLRKGAKEGMVILLWAILPSVVFAVLGYSQLWFYNILGGSVVIYLLALVLRNTQSWVMVLYVTVLLGVVGVISVHIYNPDIITVWDKQLNNYFQLLKQQWDTTKIANAQQMLAVLAKLATGIQIVFLMISNLVSLLFARWWQSLLYNPGALRPELCNIRLSFIAIGILFVFVLGSLGGVAVAIDNIPVVIMPFVFAGLSLLHSVIAMVKASKIWLVVFYSLWVILFPYVTILLLIVALVDSWWDFRHRLQLHSVMKR